jgi:hypothetical protein
MTKSIQAVAATLLFLPQLAIAQQPPRPVDTPRSVTLTLAEYNRLVDLARQQQGVAPPPVAAVVASANLRVRVDRDTARGLFNVSGDVLRPDVSRVSLLSGATLIDANNDGRPLPLIADGNAHTALLSGPGPFSLTLEWGAPLVFRPGRASFVLPVPQAGTARATIDLPGEQADVRLSAGLVTRRTVVDGRTIVEATLDPGSATEVWWSMRDSAPVAAAREVRTLADVLTLITLGDSDVRMAALIDVTVVQGELRTLALSLPGGYELTGISGSTLDTSESRDDGVVLTLGDPAARSHQILITLERPHDGGSFTVDTGFIAVREVQRERGEIVVEGIGTLDLRAAERNGMQRIDVRELHQALQEMARLPMLSAFRYQRNATAAPGLSLEVRRFEDAGVLAAVADSATVTTLVTSEGRALTEVTLRIQNRAQPFLKVSLPPGATMVSVDVAGETAKPVLGVDGTRVPLLRPGFRPSGTYEVSFVYMHAGAPFERKGDMQMTLPKLDIPVGIVEWELFVPERYSAKAVGGNVLAFTEHSYAIGTATARRQGVAGGVVFGNPPTGMARVSFANGSAPGEIRGRATDASGAALPGVTVELSSSTSNHSAITRPDGTFLMSGIPAAPVTLTASLAGFSAARTSFVFDSRPRQVDFELRVSNLLEETLTVTGVSQQQMSRRGFESSAKIENPQTPPSQNVVNLQRRASGVLPVRVDVPRAGTSHRFIKPLVVDQEAFVTLRYKRR